MQYMKLKIKTLNNNHWIQIFNSSKNSLFFHKKNTKIKLLF